MNGKDKLEKWAEYLLDMGKRNNLINFRDTRSTTAEVILPDASHLLDKTESSAVFEVFDPKIEEEPEIEMIRESDMEILDADFTDTDFANADSADKDYSEASGFDAEISDVPDDSRKADNPVSAGDFITENVPAGLISGPVSVQDSEVSSEITVVSAETDAENGPELPAVFKTNEDVCEYVPAAETLRDFSLSDNKETFKDYEYSEDSLANDDSDSTDNGENFSDRNSSERNDIPADDPKEVYTRAYAQKLKKKNQLLLYNAYSSPMAAVKNIHKKAKTILEENGVNVAYMVFGFIHWTEKGSGNRSFAAPILLAPVRFKNESAVSPYYIHMTEEDVILNPTFSFKLAHEYRVTLPEYNGEPFHEYMDSVEELMKKLHFTVTRECKIGLFSFTKLNMYQDLTSNADIIMKNPLAGRLLGDETAFSEESAAMAIDSANTEFHNVVDADSSQTEAIAMAKSGASFVLQGPPGTGKSQTITNIIAECLYDDKKVLFVSEKQAALNVVYKKLTDAGLEEFCLELHSYKANKKAVIEELCQTLRQAHSKVGRDSQTVLAGKQTAAQHLDGYTEALHAVREIPGISLYRFFEIAAGLKDTPVPDYFFHDLTGTDCVWHDQVLECLKKYDRFTSSVGYDYRDNIWFGFRSEDNSRMARQQLKEDLNAGIRIIAKLDDAGKKFSACTGLPVNNPADVSFAGELCAWISGSKYIQPSWLAVAVQSGTSGLYALKDQISDLMDACKNYTDSRNQILTGYEQDVMVLNADRFNKQLTRQFTNGFTRIFNKEYRDIMSELRINRKSGKKLSYDEAVSLTAEVVTCQTFRELFFQKELPLKDYLGGAYASENTDWNSLMDELEQLAGYLEQNAERINLSGFGRLSCMSEAEWTGAKSEMAGLLRGFALSLDEQKVYDRIISSFNPGLYNIMQISLTDLAVKLNGCLSEFDRLSDWSGFSVLAEEMLRLDICDYLNCALDEKIPSECLADSFERVYADWWIDYILNTDPSLIHVTKESLDADVENFCRYDRQSFPVSTAQIKEKLSAKRPSLQLAVPGSQVSVLLREGEKKRRQKSIRTLFSETGELIQRIKPCFLMSPLSVSTYLNNENIHFDVVIFDEASQIFPQDALGAIYRGKQLIVVGDSKQMPPTDFFTATGNTTVDEMFQEERADISDFESVLDICNAVLPSRSLKWHYRSRYEQLIAFSNRNFYHNNLITFPSSSGDRPGIGVDYHYAGGIFEHRKRYNRREAEYIVDLIWNNLKTYPERSLGVVAFSISQQDYIERLVLKRRTEDPSLEEYFRSDRPEPFFIKNLETVQGDERDTIIFSIAYAKDERGVLVHNFGPLNRAGGERRLNVAITRAKMNVQVVASIHGSDIDLHRTSAEGAKLLKEYLDYAKYGTSVLSGQYVVNDAVSAGKSESVSGSALLNQISGFLDEHDLKTDSKIGCSSFKIDLALRDPKSPDYALAICLDGDSYKNAGNTRDRNRLHREVLERMGWNYLQLWSADWMKRPEGAKQALLTSCENCLAAIQERKTEEAEQTVSQNLYPTVQITPEISEEQTSYEITDTRTISEISETPAEFAAPVNRTGFENPARSTSDKKTDEQADLTDPAVQTIYEETAESEVFHFPVYVYTNLADAMTRSENILFAIREVLKTEAPLSEEWLMKRMLFFFGRSRVTEKVKSEYENLISYCGRYGILRKDGFLYLNNTTIENIMLRVPETDSVETLRPIPAIAAEELASGMRVILDNNGAMEKDILFREMVTLLGFSRRNESINVQLEKAYRLLMEETV